jgi:tellurite resistance protein
MTEAALASAPSPAPAAPFVARVPTALFGAVLGIGGLANGWRVAARLWGVPSLVGDALAVLAFAVWATVATLVALKWVKARGAARGELGHPVMGGFVALVGVATMVAGLAVQPIVPPLGAVVMVAGIVFQGLFAAWFVGRLLQGGRDVAGATPVLFLPTVGGGFVAGTALAALGLRDASAMAFGIGFVTWLVIEGVIWQRLLHGPALPVPLRSTMGIEMAPPAVGLVAYLAANGGSVDILALMLFGVALLWAAIAVRNFGWVSEQPFGAPWWAWSFGVASLPTGAMRLAEAGAPTASLLAPGLFLVGNLIIGLFAGRSLAMVLRGTYVPPMPPAPPPQAA